MRREAQGKVKARSKRGQGKVKVRSRQCKHNINRNYNLMSFDTIDINLVCGCFDKKSGHCDNSCGGYDNIGELELILIFSFRKFCIPTCLGPHY